MRPLAKLIVPLGVLLFAAGSVCAQNLTSSRFTDPATLIQNKAVQKHLDLDEATIQKAFNIPILIRQEAESAFKDLAKIKDDAEHERQKQELKKKTMKKGIEELAKILKPEDLKRLKEIALQMADFQAFSTKDVKAALAISADQEKRLKSIIEAGNQEMQHAIGGAKSTRAIWTPCGEFPARHGSKRWRRQWRFSRRTNEKNGTKWSARSLISHWIGPGKTCYR